MSENPADAMAALVARANAGDRAARNTLFAALYDELVRQLSTLGPDGRDKRRASVGLQVERSIEQRTQPVPERFVPLTHGAP